MSLRENIELFHQLDIDKYLDVLKQDFGVRDHPSQTNSFLVGDPGLPFYKPRQAEDHISILGFNYVPLPSILLQAMVDHPELIPDGAFVRWTAEQELIMESYLGDLRSSANRDHVSGE